MAEAVDAPDRAGRRGEILDAAGRLFAERGIRETTVRGIGEQVGVLAGSLYYYFSTKQEIVHALMRPYVEELLERYRVCVNSGGKARAQLEGLVRTALEAMLEHPHENAILQRELDRMFAEAEFAYLQEAVARIEEIYVDVIRAGVAEGDLRGDVEPRFLFRMIMDVVKGAAYWYDPSEHDVDRVTGTWWKVLGEGIDLPRGVSA
ncbi:MAG: TetR/AcrR family transcriptional regulator [Deltaproteobacteria bacterium]|jgi:AcrR family transcriptional regulator|nr:TetR/AcrR family transcriptional regulator [Deltaproteobacteria bacterium]MBW2499708.1 TetR/AcrR family transcriptional regulator [Deltaproteobacteria bacterium]